MSTALLHDFLNDHFEQFFADAKVSELSVNKPGELWVAKQGEHAMLKFDKPDLTYEALIRFATLVAQSTDQRISLKQPVLSAQIPTKDNPDKFYRIQFVQDPAVAKNSCAFSIRKPSLLNLPFDAYKNMFEECGHRLVEERGQGVDINTPAFRRASASDKELYRLYDSGDLWNFLRLAVPYRKNIFISAGTDSGKTTLFNALTSLIPIGERIITIEDAKELTPPHPNLLQLYYSRGGQGKADVTAQSLIEACLRLRPNRILMGEIRGLEAFAFLNLISSGHPGAISTLHANNTENALDRLGMMVGQDKESRLSTEAVKELVHQNIDIIIQMERTEDGGYSVADLRYADWENKQVA